MTKRVVCKHGHPIGVEIDPAEVFTDAAGKDGYIIQRITMPVVCDRCLLEAVGLADGEQQDK